ncbi:MAG: TRAM domain-containing protein [Candidatus Aenigmarchaeota archaeon]|nr:TRAM domain-containing protein [Candidatus Aenigmarchaeota archaeon]
MRFGERRSFGRFGGSRFERESNEPKPVKVGEEYDVEIKETGSKGDGIARINNFVVFVNGAKLGEKIHIKIKDVRNKYAIGERTDEVKSAEGETSEKKETTEMKYDDDEEESESENEEQPEEE